MIAVYSIEHVQSGRRYVGHSVCVRARWLAHRRLLKLGKHHCPHLQNAWKRDGEESFRFVVLEICASREDAIAAEQSLLDKHYDNGALYNASRFASLLDIVAEARQKAHSLESQKKRIATTKANDSWCAGQRIVVRSTCLSSGLRSTFRSLNEASRTLGVSAGNISSVCNGKRPAASGYTFSFFWPGAEKVAA